MNSDNAVAPEPKKMRGIYHQKHNRAELVKWPILQMLRPDFLARIHIAFVYGNQALVVTNNDKVYAIGMNSLGCLDANRVDCEEVSRFQPREVQELSGKGINTFYFCNNSTVVALGNDGTVYYTEGVGFIVINAEMPAGVFLNRAIAHDIACQQNKIFVLSGDGQVYIWQKEVSSVSLSLSKIYPDICTSCITRIECTHAACIALTQLGEVYIWDTTKIFQTPKATQFPYGSAFGTKDDSKINFTRVNMPNGAKIEQIAGGYHHILALSTTGDIYTSQVNGSASSSSSSQSSIISSKENILSGTPQRVPLPTIGQVLEIAATPHSNISVAATTCGKIFMWGECGGVLVKVPLLTPCTSIHEVFQKFTMRNLMHQPLVINRDCKSSSYLETLASAFDDPETSDFIIQVEGKPIHVHKAILKITSEYFRRMFATDCMENDKNVMEHKEFSYDVYKAFLKYLYTGKVALSSRDTLELLLLANQYLEDQLQRHCEENIANGLTVSNVLHVLVTARQHSIKDLELICTEFVMNHMTAVVKSEDFPNLDGETAKTLMQEAANHGKFKN